MRQPFRFSFVIRDGSHLPRATNSQTGVKLTNVVVVKTVSKNCVARVSKRAWRGRENGSVPEFRAAALRLRRVRVLSSFSRFCCRAGATAATGIWRSWSISKFLSPRNSSIFSRAPSKH
ncbi:uncharacterized protein [Physcomitrium patens]|uniref:Uncharacterized protein n=1 Tax=Physcomitrium patens TaxID=3218 RepID=A0A2K1LBK1_PHYPA|nr:hypothetical protein PHYPA_001829 [Physcomitrium patens]